MPNRANAFPLVAAILAVGLMGCGPELGSYEECVPIAVGAHEVLPVELRTLEFGQWYASRSHESFVRVPPGSPPVDPADGRIIIASTRSVGPSEPIVLQAPDGGSLTVEAEPFGSGIAFSAEHLSEGCWQMDVAGERVSFDVGGLN